MILSKKNKFIFIKGRKVAGTSMEVLLSSICGESDIITPITPVDEKLRMTEHQCSARNYGANSEEHLKYITQVSTFALDKLKNIKHPQGAYFNHMSLEHVIKLYGEIPSDWCILAIERCPYRKIISLANMQLKMRSYQTSGKAMISELVDIKKQITQLIDSKSVQLVKNIDLYKDSNGDLSKIRILRYENLKDDISKLMQTLNIEKHYKLPHLKQGMSSLNIDLTDVFSKNQFTQVNEIFDEEFEFFGYKKFS